MLTWINPTGHLMPVHIYHSPTLACLTSALLITLHNVLMTFCKLAACISGFLSQVQRRISVVPLFLCLSNSPLCIGGGP